MTRLALLALLTMPLASAHRPQAAEEMLEIELPKVSHVVGGKFEAGDEVFRVLLTYDEPFAMPMELMVPKVPKNENHRPAFAMVGPGLPTPTAEQIAVLPFEVPDGSGVYIDLNQDEREVYFEQVMRRNLWTTGSVALHLPAAATYEVWVWSPEFTVGEFWFGFGVEEDFSGGAWGPVFQNWGTFGW